MRFIRYLLVLFSLSLFIYGKSWDLFNVTLISIVTFWIVNLIYCFENIGNRIYFLVFNITVFVFLISRPFISFIRGNSWWNFERSSVNFALNSLMLTLVFMFLGNIFAESIMKRKNFRLRNKVSNIKKEREKYKSFDYIENSDFIKNLRLISIILFYFTFVFLFITETEKFLVMRSKSYVEYYTSFESSLPFLFLALGSMCKYFLCVFLASMPKKSMAFIPLFLFIVSTIPDFLIGLRNPIVLNVIFVFLYYFTRDNIDCIKYSKKDNEKVKVKWLGKMEWSLIVLLVPCIMFVLGIYNYIRDGNTAESSGFFDIIIDLFYKQGVSFDVLCIGYEAIPKIEYTGFTNYTFGGIIDYFTHGKLAQVLWGAESLGSGNNMDMALYSNSFSHRMSYASGGQEYLNGHGWGSSYILEMYADFGYWGIILFSILIGMFFAYIIRFMGKGSFQCTMALLILTSIYFCPRNSALGFIEFIVYLQFVVPVFTCYLLSGLCVKRYTRKRHVLNYYLIS